MTELQIQADYTSAIAQFLDDAGLARASKNTNGNAQEKMLALVNTLGELFSLEEPTITDDLDQTLRLIARDAKLSNIMRERALYRLWLVTKHTKEVSGVLVPMWYGIVDDEGKQINSQEEFIGLFTSKSGIGRASTFRRMKIYNRLSELGVTGKEAWLRVLKMPSTLQDLITHIASWDGSQFMGVNREVALDLARKVKPEYVPQLASAIDNGDMETLKDLYSDVVRNVLEETDTYDDAKQLLDHITIDILGKQTIFYKWLPIEKSILAVITTPVIENGSVVSEIETEVYVWVNDDVHGSDAVLQDLFKRLPIKNKHDLPDPLT